MQPTLIDIEHRRAVWDETRRTCAPEAPAQRDTRRRLALLLVRLATRLDPGPGMASRTVRD
jgi:hypothetical protein